MSVICSKYVNFQCLLFATLFACSCSFRKEKEQGDNLVIQSNKPPAYIQKAWDARYDFDNERRLLIPKYAGSRWGAVQQYKEDGSLEYQDWWVKDLQREELAPAPSTEITTFIDEDGNLTEVKLDEPEDQDLEVSDSGDEETESNQEDFSQRLIQQKMLSLPSAHFLRLTPEFLGQIFGWVPYFSIG